MRTFAFAVVALVAGACAPAASPHALQRGPAFDFHTDPWVNLHQHIAAEAGLGWWRGKAPTCACGRASDGSVLVDWAAAVTGYETALKGRDPTFDEGLQQTNLSLAVRGERAALPSEKIDPHVAHLLAPLFPGYLQRGWPEDLAKDREWITAVTPLLARWGEGLATELAMRLDTSWPLLPVRVEVSRLAGSHGAYTSSPPILTTLSSEDPGYQGDAALEMLFHEASHGISGNLEHDLDLAFLAEGKSAPADLYHAIIFYTAGELVRRRLGPSYVPYAYKQGVYTRGEWPRLEVAMREQWQPWLLGQTDLRSTLTALAKAL